MSPGRFFREGRRLQTALVLALILFGGTIARNFLVTNNSIDRNHTALIALCALRSDLDKRIAVSQQLLDQHPRSRFIFGLPRAVIQTSLDNSQRTRRALNVLACKERP